jgi:hypothetical protein
MMWVRFPPGTRLVKAASTPATSRNGEVLRINSKHVVFGNGDLAFSDGGGGRALEEQ